VPADPPNAQRLIADCFEVDFAQPLPAAAGGRTAYVATDRRDQRAGLMAVEVGRAHPARAAELVKFTAGPVAGVLSPMAHGAARDARGQAAQYVICQAPPGPPLLAAGMARFAVWDESALIQQVLRPAAHALDLLRERGLTHRAIRPDNLYRLGPGEPVVLGCAWAAPPAMQQPALFEPPYSAMCLPAGRGAGSIADDVYALGVTLLCLALGRLPMAGEDAMEVTQRKLERGSFPALIGDERLPPVLHDIVRGMLAEDPDHRPTPAMLVDTEVARGRRVAARPPRRSQRPLEIGAFSVWTARTLGFAMAREPEAGLHGLRTGAVDRWIRRSLGDSGLAARLDEAVRVRAAQGEMATARDDSLLAMRAVAILDPQAPLCWNGVALWPDGLGPALAAESGEGASEAVLTALAELAGVEAIGIWATTRAERCDAATLRLDAHQHRALLRLKGWGGGVARLRYALNPLLACRSRMLHRESVVRLPDLLPALEALAKQGDAQAFGGLDIEIGAFIAARGELGIDAELAALADGRRTERQALAMLRLLAAVQARTRGPALPALAAWLAKRVAPALAVFKGRSRRQQREAALTELTGPGRLGALLAVLDDAEGLAADRRDHEAALAEASAIDRQIAELGTGADGRRTAARRIGQEGVAAIGVLALVYAVLAGLLT
jgi:hypothetical protein